MGRTELKNLILFILPILLSAVPVLCSCGDDWGNEALYERSMADETGIEEAGSETGSLGQEREETSIVDGIEPVSVGNDAESATVMIYMNGSDLETQAGEASRDISEMLESGIGSNANVIIQTMGTKKWQDYGISSKTSQIYRLNSGSLELLEGDLGQLDCTKSKTLSDFIAYGKKNYPADRYVLIFWDHGGGPVYGFGYDEWQDETASLTLDEIQAALSDNSDIIFDIIGMDCCIMANIETCYVLSPFCKYSVLSEDFESSLGWSYTDWMKRLEDNPGIATPLLGKKIIDSVIKANEDDSEEGQSSTMILVNERAVPDLLNKWTVYAYSNADALLGKNYSRLHKARGRGFMEALLGEWENDESYVTMDDYYVSDILSIVESVGKDDEASDGLRSALKACAAYFGHTSDRNELTGLAVSLPYGDSSYYNELEKVYSKCGFDREYIDWLKNFVDAEGSGSHYDYSGFEDSWGGWGSYEEGWGSCGEEWDFEDWEYDYEEEIWYIYEDGIIYLYDEETDTIFCYNEDDDEMLYYDEEADDWYPAE